MLTLSVPDEGYTYVDLERTWWKLFQLRTVRIKLDIYVFILNSVKSNTISISVI
jgi:hypothetical protein